MSFRWVANGLVPCTNPRKRAALGLALLFAAGCGGGGGHAERLVRGLGYSFSAPVGWPVVRSGREVKASNGLPLVLDRAAAGLAAQQQGTVAASRTVTISGRRARSYDIDYSHDGKQLVEQLAFVLRGETEYLLLCRYVSGGDTGACDRLVATFKLA